MEPDQEPADDLRELDRDAPAGPAQPGHGRQDVVESEGPPEFWTEVDGMLTGEFSADLLPKAGDYRLGAIPDALPNEPQPADAVSADPFDLLPPDATGPVIAPQPQPTDVPRPGAHDLFPPAETPQLPFVEGRDGGRLFETGAQPGAVAPPDHAQPQVVAPAAGGDALNNQVGHVPLFDPTGEVQLSTQAGGPTPVSLERSTVVDPVNSPAPGSTFLEGDSAAHHAGVPVAPPSISLEPGGHTNPNQPGPFHQVPQIPTAYESRSILLDVVDRQWLTSALVVVAAISIGVIGWLVLLGGDDGNGGTELVAAPTTTADPAGPATDDNSAAASAGAGTGSFDDSTTSPSTTAPTETSELEARQGARTAVSRKPGPTVAGAGTVAPTRPPTTPTTASTESTDTSDASSSSSSSSETTTDPSVPSTPTTDDGTVTTAGSSSSSTPSSDTTTNSSTPSSDTTTNSSTPTSETTPDPTNPDSGSSTP